MIPAPIPSDEAARLSALYQTNILDTGFDQSFDRLVRLISRVLNVPITLVSLIDEDRQWFKARVGLQTSQTSRDISFCGHAILDDATMVVEDATQDERFKDNPLVLGAPQIRFYAGAPIITREGFRLGTVCAIDTRPRKVSSDEVEFLEEIAKIASIEIEANRVISEAIETRNAAERAMREKDRLIAYLAHDIRSPVGAMLGFAELLKLDNKDSLSAKQRERVGLILEGGNHVIDLIGDILQQSQLAESNRVAHLTPTDLPLLLNRVAQLFEPLANRAGLKIELDIQHTPIALIDPIWTTQILTNLLSNAIKYNKEQGRVILHLSRGPNGRFLLKISDTGVGIPGEKRVDLFKPYSRLGRECSQTPGTGLGLSIVKRLVEMMGGTISTDDFPGGGTTFTVELPGTQQQLPLS